MPVSASLNDRNLDGLTVVVDTVAAAGTPEQLASLAVPDGLNLVVRARSVNTDVVYVANSSANASGTHRITLNSGDAVLLRVTNANILWIDAAVNGEGVEVFVET